MSENAGLGLALAASVKETPAPTVDLPLLVSAGVSPSYNLGGGAHSRLLISDMAVASNGDIYTVSTIWQAKSNGSNIYQFAHEFSPLIRKYNSSLVLQWEKVFDWDIALNNANGMPASIVLDEANSCVYLATQPLGGVESGYNKAYAVFKFSSSDGSLLAHKIFSIAGSSLNQNCPAALGLMSDGSILYYIGEGGAGTYGRGPVVVKMNSSLTITACKHIGISAGFTNHAANRIYVDSSDNVFLTGRFSGACGIIKLNSSLQPVAGFTYTGVKAIGITQDSSGNFYITDQRASTNSVGGVTKLDSNLLPIWGRTFLANTSGLATGRSEAHDVKVDSSGNVYVSGRSDRFGANAYPLNYIMKIDADGNYVDSICFSGFMASYQTFSGYEDRLVLQDGHLTCLMNMSCHNEFSGVFFEAQRGYLLTKIPLDLNFRQHFRGLYTQDNYDYNGTGYTADNYGCDVFVSKINNAGLDFVVSTPTLNAMSGLAVNDYSYIDNATQGTLTEYSKLDNAPVYFEKYTPTQSLYVKCAHWFSGRRASSSRTIYVPDFQTGDIIIAIYNLSSTSDSALAISGLTEIRELYANDTNDTNIAVYWKAGTSDTTGSNFTKPNVGEAGQQAYYVISGGDSSTTPSVNSVTRTNGIWSASSTLSLSGTNDSIMVFIQGGSGRAGGYQAMYDYTQKMQGILLPQSSSNGTVWMGYNYWNAGDPAFTFGPILHSVSNTADSHALMLVKVEKAV